MEASLGYTVTLCPVHADEKLPCVLPKHWDSSPLSPADEKLFSVFRTVSRDFTTHQKHRVKSVATRVLTDACSLASKITLEMTSSSCTVKGAGVVLQHYQLGQFTEAEG